MNITLIFFSSQHFLNLYYLAVTILSIVLDYLTQFSLYHQQLVLLLAHFINEKTGLEQLSTSGW